MRVHSKSPAFLKRKVRGRWFSAQILLGCVLALAIGCKEVNKRYTLRGQVVGINFNKSQLIVNHEEIPGFMPAMTMPYDVRNANLLNAVQAGDRITADIVVPDNGPSWLENIVITDKSQRKTASTSAGAGYLKVGDKVPDVPLVNQDGKAIHFNRFRGKAVLFTFIYTRCPNPDYCPLLSSDFAAMRKELFKNPAECGATHLISISLDPAYDTPPVMRKYGLIYLEGDPAGFTQWDFVSTTADDLKKLAGGFGLEYTQDGNQITHSMNTILLAPDGTVAAMWPDQFLKHAEILAAMRKTLAAGK